MSKALFELQHCINWAWWCTAVIPALGYRKQENQKVRVILCYKMIFRPDWKTKPSKKQTENPYLGWGDRSEHLLNKCEGLSSNLQHQHKYPSAATYTCNTRSVAEDRWACWTSTQLWVQWETVLAVFFRNVYYKRKPWVPNATTVIINKTKPQGLMAKTCQAVFRLGLLSASFSNFKWGQVQRVQRPAYGNQSTLPNTEGCAFTILSGLLSPKGSDANTVGFSRHT